MKSRICVLAVVIGVTACCTMVSAQGFGRGRGGPRGGPGGGFGGDPGLMLLMNDQVREELEIVPEQLEKLQAIGEKAREGMREMFSGMRDLSDEDRQARWEEIRGKMQERTKQMQDEINAVLLPNQVDRLKQIRVQMMFQRGAAGALGSDLLAEQLGITDAQKEQLEKVRTEVEEELREKMAEIRKEAEEKILGVLTQSQRDQLKKMRGESFEFQFRRPGGDRGPRPGGDRST